MKLKVAEYGVEETVELDLRADSRNTITVESADGYSIVGFRVVDGRVSLIRYSSVGGISFNTNDNGQIEEVNE